MIGMYSAPLEGITGFAYRNTHHANFAGIEKYYTPFLAPNYTHNLKTREREDIAPSNNAGMPLIPQILTNRAGDFLWAAEEIYALGYREINLNLGCPMPTVVKKHRGSGQLGDLDALDRFLEEICAGMDGLFGLEENKRELSAGMDRLSGREENKRELSAGTDRLSGREEICAAEQNLCPEIPEKSPGKKDSPEENYEDPEPEEQRPDKLRFSIKTRIGLDSSDKAEGLLEIYNRYPLCELIVHPRTQKDLYGGSPDPEVFEMFLKGSAHPVVYNGDIFTVNDFEKIRSRFPDCRTIMLGRGLIANPALARELSGGRSLEKEELRYFHDALFEALQATLPGTGPLLGKMKELWFYMGRNFRKADKYLKEIKKAKDLVRYRSAVRMLFSQCDFI